MARLDALRVEEGDEEVAGEGWDSEMVCGETSIELRRQINELLAGVKAIDGKPCTTGKEVDGMFVITRSNGKRITPLEANGVSRALGDKFQLERPKIDGERVYAVKRREAFIPDDSTGGGRTGRRAERRAERKARQDERRRTNPRLKPVK